MTALDRAMTGISGTLVAPYGVAGDNAPAPLAPILDRAPAKAAGPRPA